MNKINNKGFSLIELLVIIAIIGIMTGISLVSFMESKKKKEVEISAREVAAAVREAQNYALTGKGAKNGASICTGYTFTWNSGLTTYGFRGINEASCTLPLIFNYTLKNGVLFSNGSSFNITFPHADLNISSTAPIRMSKGSHTYTVCVFQSGRAEEISGTTCP